MITERLPFLAATVAVPDDVRWCSFLFEHDLVKDATDPKRRSVVDAGVARGFVVER